MTVHRTVAQDAIRPTGHAHGDVMSTNHSSVSERPVSFSKEARSLPGYNRNSDARSTSREVLGLKERFCRFQQKELLLWHCGSVIVSFWCYILAFILIGSEPTRRDQVARICLWYPPIVLEILAHFAVATIVDNKEWQYDAAAVHARRSVIFTIILGAGLDNMTDNFHFMVGNLSFGTHRFFIIICAGLNIIFLFTLHYTNFKTISEKRNSKTKRRRVLASFVLYFFYLCALVVTLQGMSAIIQIGVCIS